MGKIRLTAEQVITFAVMGLRQGKALIVLELLEEWLAAAKTDESKRPTSEDDDGDDCS